VNQNAVSLVMQTPSVPYMKQLAVQIIKVRWTTPE